MRGLTVPLSVQQAEQLGMGNMYVEIDFANGDKIRGTICVP